MTALAPTLEAFFTERLGRQLQASPHTVRAYRDTFRLLLAFAERCTGKAPSARMKSPWVSTTMTNRLISPLLARLTYAHLHHK